jgi:hypothetical protein
MNTGNQRRWRNESRERKEVEKNKITGKERRGVGIRLRYTLK